MACGYLNLCGIWKMTKFCSSWKIYKQNILQTQRKLYMSPVVPKTPIKALLVT